MEIATVDTQAMTITVQPKNSTANTSKTYKFTAQTKITVNGQPATVSDLKPGLQIRVGTGSHEDTADELSATPPPADPNEKR